MTKTLGEWDMDKMTFGNLEMIMIMFRRRTIMTKRAKENDDNMEGAITARTRKINIIRRRRTAISRRRRTTTITKKRNMISS